MAMLAGPKRKQKFSFDPRNTNWSNDESKFGHKLMEKMGWSKGKGLGANEDGSTENVAVKLKNDTRGVGCTKSHADNWIAHQDDFNALLSNLNQDHSTGNSNTEQKVISLEHKSRTSKGRVHYQKFTKGKDLSLKSETDLDCVFGKRKSQSGTNTPQPQSESSSDNEDRSNGFNTVTSTDSVQDYFKKKMAEKLNRLAGYTVGNQENTVNCNKETEKQIVETDATAAPVEEGQDGEIKSKKKKKSKKRKREASDDDIEKKVQFYIEPTELLDNQEVESVESEVVKKKKKKKSKNNECTVESVDLNSVVDDCKTDEQTEEVGNEEVLEEKTKKKKKKKKNKK